MHRTLWRWQLGGFLFVSGLGTILHFLYDGSGQFIGLAPFVAVNESIWEHEKLLFLPLFLWALLERNPLSKSYPHFWAVKWQGTVLGLLLIPVLYYTYTGAVGIADDRINILIFFVSAAAVFWYETHALRHGHPARLPERIAPWLLVGLLVLFAVLTFFPSAIPLFEDPLTGKAGIPALSVVSPQ